MAQECQMDGSVFGHRIALIICVEKIVRLMGTMCNVHSVVFPHFPMKKD
jgi:hypothetical protein